jgi:RimJ/RimL family protein N-acetyltransferase
VKLAPAVLENTHVRLEPFKEDHREPLRAASADPAIWTYVMTQVEGDKFDAFFDSEIARMETGAAINHAVVVKSSGEIVGGTAFFMIDPPHATVEIGCTWYAPKHWGGVVNPACKLLLLERGFACGVRRVELKTHAKNARSRAAIEKLGAKLDGIHRRRHTMPDGSVRDTAYYSILDDEWPAVRAKLLARLAQ